MVTRGWHESNYLRIEKYVLPLDPKAVMRRCGYPNENWGDNLEKEEWRLRGEPQHLLHGRKMIMTPRCLTCMTMSKWCHSLVKEYKTLTALWGGIWWVSLGYTEFEMALNLCGEVEWAVIYMTLLPWREIWTVEDKIGVYHHIDGNGNFGSEMRSVRERMHSRKEVTNSIQESQSR